MNGEARPFPAAPYKDYQILFRLSARGAMGPLALRCKYNNISINTDKEYAEPAGRMGDTERNQVSPAVATKYLPMNKNPFHLSQLRGLALLALLSALPSLHATNGMNMEGYGPVATALGGASLAYDNGTAAVINNPATLGLMEGDARLDLALGILGPHIKVSSPATAPNIFGVPASQSAKSSATAFYMPAMGYVRRRTRRPGRS